MINSNNSFDYGCLVQRVISECPWHKSPVHGLAHWQNVERNALFLAEDSGLDTHLLRLFALFHDCRRISDSFDLDHGPRAAEYLISLNDSLLRLPEKDLFLLAEAVDEHTTISRTSDPFKACCWDADRLDITRVLPDYDLAYFSTSKAVNLIESDNLQLLYDYKYSSILAYL